MDNTQQTTACFTGHRPKPWMRYIPGDRKYTQLCSMLDDAICLLIEQYGVDMFLCGMAEGFDLVAGMRVLALRRYGRIPDSTSLIAVQPFPDHCRGISSAYWQGLYAEILQCSSDTCVVTQQYQEDAFRRRNAYMVEHSAFVVAYWNGGQRSGTGQTVRMAQKKGDRTIINLYDLL